MGFFIRTGRRGDEHELVDLFLKFTKGEGPVVHRRGQTEAVIDQGLFPSEVSVEHTVQLRNRHVALVHDDQEIVREIVNQCIRRRAGRKAGQIPGIVFNARAEAGLAHHFDIEHGAFLNALRLDELVILPELRNPFLQVLLNLAGGIHQLLVGDDIVRGRKEGCVRQARKRFSRQGIELLDPVDLIAEKFDPYGLLAALGGENLKDIAPDPESAPFKLHLGPFVLVPDKLVNHLVPVLLHAGPKRHHHVRVVHR